MRLQVATTAEDFDALTAGTALRRAMRVAELPQDLVAQRVGINGGHLNRLLRGFRTLTPEMAERIRLAVEELAPADVQW
jgi:plasmid maintenance system antidote protein VapI